jgi:hypothetical protein
MTVDAPTSFGEDSCGRVYVASHTGPVFRLVDGTPTECPVAQAGAGPGLDLKGRKRQSIDGTRKLKLKATASDSATVELSGAVTAGRQGEELFDLAPESAQLVAGALQRLKLKLSGKEAQRARHRIRRGKRSRPTSRGRPSTRPGDAARPADFEARLVLE